MADYSRNEAELQRIKNDGNGKAQAKKAKITSYLENSSTRRATYSRRTRNLVITVSA